MHKSGSGLVLESTFTHHATADNKRAGPVK